MDSVVSTDTVTIRANGQEIVCDKGARLLDVLLQNGIHVPHLCYFERLSPYAGCRTCVVEIEGVRGTPVSCTATVTDGMVVTTESQKIDEIRHGVMEYILCDHPGRCFDCHRLEHCGPGLICLRDEIVTERCLTCAKNRFCELQEVSEHINMRGRNLYYTETQTWYGEKNDREVMRIIRTNPFIELEFDKCIVCTRCVRVCDEVRGRGVFTLSYKGPQAKIDTMFGVPMQDTDCEFCGACVDVCPTAAIMDKTTKWVGIPDRTVETVCTECSVGCGIKLAVKKGTLTQGLADFDGPANRGQICAKGRYGQGYVQAPDRLGSPRIRKDGGLQDATWDEALSLVAEQLKAAGAGSAFLTSARLTNEDLYLVRQVAAGLGSSAVDHTRSALSRRTLAVMRERVGSAAAATNTWRAIAGARTVFLLGTGVTQTHSVAGVEVMEAVRRNGARFIVATHDEPEIIRLCGDVSLNLRYREGTEAALVAGLLAAVRGDSAAVEAAAAVTGVAGSLIQQAGSELAASASTAILAPVELPWMAGTDDVVHGVLDLAAVSSANAASGGVYWLLPDANTQGAADMAGEAGGAGTGAIVDGLASGSLTAAWLVDVTNMAQANLAVLRDALQKAAFVVVQATAPTPLDDVAHVILPGQVSQEKAGTVTNNERRIQRLQPGVTPAGDSRPDWQILAEVGRRAGIGGIDYTLVDDVTAALVAATPAYAGLDLDTAPCWPLDAGRLADRSTSIQVAAGGDDSLALRNLYSGMTARLSAPVDGVAEIAEIHPDDAARLGIGDGDTVVVTGGEGRVQAVARISAGGAPGAVRLGYLYRESLDTLPAGGRVAIARA